MGFSVDQPDKRSIFTAPRIFTGEDWLKGHGVVTNGEQITDIVPLSSIASSEKVQDFKDCIIAPSFIDLQIYGAYGNLFAVYPEPDSLSLLHRCCREGGAWYFLPTLATNTLEVFRKGIDAVREYWNDKGEGVLGLHLEGPWINPSKRGAHVEDLIHSPELDEVRELLDYGKGVIKMITLAPEVCSDEIIDLIGSYGIIISAGHSDCTYQEAQHGFEKGIKSVTHLYNAMSALRHREPGLVGAAMNDSKVYASIIPDGYHVDYSAISIAKKIMKERLFIITDAVTQTTEGYYKHSLEGEKYEADGILSGSNLNMIKAVQNLVKFAGIETGEAIKMASTYPATLMGLKQQGKIEKGYSAHVVVLDNNLGVKKIL